jgi:hypothetical protein
MFRYLNHFSVFTLSLLMAAALLMPRSVIAADPEESEEEEARERAERSAPPGGFREGMITEKAVEIYLDGKKIGMVTNEEFEQLKNKEIFSPRGPKKGWMVMDAIQREGIKTARTVRFISQHGRQMDIAWNDLARFQDDVVLTFNFKGELVLETDVADKMPDHIRDMAEDRVRDEMHKSRQRSLIFLRNVKRIELISN